jgi:hypothetical protein
MDKIVKKLIKNKKGESIAETLIALLVSTFAMMILAGALVTAAKVNIGAKKAYTFMDTVRGSSTGASTAAISISTGTSGSGASVQISSLENTTVTLYTDKYTVGGVEKNYYYWIPEITKTPVSTTSDTNSNPGG